MSVLERIRGPRDLDELSDAELTTLADEIREFLVATCAKTGGHLGPNLGMVELTLALHRVFESPHDKIIYDVGHQAYVHKLVTGRKEGFARLRQAGGFSGYPSRAESEHDLVENSHASPALSYADGLAKAYALRSERRAVVAVVGDGALTGGMAWEALNNIAAAKDRPVIIVVNDNGRSYTPTIGGFAEHLATLRTSPRYEQVLEVVKRSLHSTPLVGQRLYDVLHGVKRGLKDAVAPQGLFEDLGLKYVGPVDGHNRTAVEQALRQAKGFGSPVIVHCLTRKGFGYDVAERDEVDHWHQTGGFDASTGVPKSEGRRWTDVFASELLALGRERSDIVAVTAAMAHPTGLNAFGEEFPDRLYDVGIAEQHAVTSAAGLAMGGLHPVVAIYATFLNRAFDQMLMDVALHNCAATFVLDRAGVTGSDGASHNGMWDLSVLQVVPGLSIAAPRDGERVRELLREAVEVTDGPTVLRFPKAPAADELPALESVDGYDVLARPADGLDTDVLIVAVGALAGTCREVSDRLAEQGIGASVVDPRWVKPVNPALVELAAAYRLVVTVEDNGRVGGCGAAFGLAMSDAGVRTPLHVAGIEQRFLDHGSRPEILADLGLSAQPLARDIVERVASLQDAPVDLSQIVR